MLESVREQNACLERVDRVGNVGFAAPAKDVGRHSTRCVHSAVVDWERSSEYICKARGARGDLIVTWGRGAF